MHATRACRRAALLSSSTCRPYGCNLVARHLERSLFLSRSALGPLTRTSGSAVSSSRRNFSTPTAPRRAQYSRFDDDPNRPPSQSTGIQRRDIIIFTFGAGSIIYYIFHLEQVPETGRWRFMDVSPKYEAALWEASYAELSNQFRNKLLPPSHVITQHVHRVVSRILDANDLGTLRGDPRTPMTPPLVAVLQQPGLGGLGNGGGDREEGQPDLWDPDANATAWRSSAAQGKEWNLLVVNDQKVVNAMAAPGTVVVFTGILPVAKDEQGLAAILGHEIGHVVARHTAERYSYSKVLIAFAWLAEIIGLPYGFGNIVTTLLMELPHSRKQEYEADKIGMKLSAKACFDPTAAPSMFKRLGALEKSGGGVNVSFLNTHPASDDRVKELETLLPEAFAIQASACGGISDYLGGFGEAVASGLGIRTPWEK